MAPYELMLNKPKSGPANSLDISIIFQALGTINEAHTVPQMLDCTIGKNPLKLMVFES